MAFKSKLVSVTALLLANAVFSSVAVRAEDWTAREAELVGLHQLCDKGDRKACIRFGMMLGEAKVRHAGSVGIWRSRFLYLPRAFRGGTS
jgi:hypothetical protein